MNLAMIVTKNCAPLWPPEGFYVLRNLLGANEVSLLHHLIDLHRQQVPPSRQILYTHQLPPVLTNTSTDTVNGAPIRGMEVLMEQWLNPHRHGTLSTLSVAESLRERIRHLLQSVPVLFQDLLMSKNPGHQPMPFHQDFPFWPVAEPVGGVLWVALDSIDQSVGGLSLAAGSHIDGIGPPIDLHSGLPQPGFVCDPIDLARYTVDTPVLAPGDAIWFHPLLWHRSDANLSGRQRRVWNSTWLPSQAHWSRQNAPRHPLANRLQEGSAVGEHGWTPMLFDDKERL